jgi:hypothetical protein
MKSAEKISRSIQEWIMAGISIPTVHEKKYLYGRTPEPDHDLKGGPWSNIKLLLLGWPEAECRRCACMDFWYIFFWTMDIWTTIFWTTIFLDYYLLIYFYISTFFVLTFFACIIILTFFLTLQDLEFMAICFFNSLCWPCMNFDRFWDKLWCELVRLLPLFILHILGEKIVVQKYCSSENRGSYVRSPE